MSKVKNEKATSMKNLPVKPAQTSAHGIAKRPTEAKPAAAKVSSAPTPTTASKPVMQKAPASLRSVSKTASLTASPLASSSTAKPVVAPTPAASARATEAKPVEAKPAEVKPVEAKPVEAKPVEAKPAEAKPVEAKPVEAKPAETRPVEAKPAETRPVEAKPAETKPVGSKAPASSPAAQAAAPKPLNARLPAAGTVIQKRNRHGAVRCECVVEESGIRYKAVLYSSLSGAAVAAAKDLGLNNKTQNGFTFWGLTKPGRTGADPLASLNRAWERYHGGAIALLKAGVSEEIKPQIAAALQSHAQTLTSLHSAAL